jgi:large subunit ribosomal protein L32e
VEVQVHNIGDLSLIDPETQAARIGRTVGTRKRNAIVEEALRRSIRVLNLGKSRQIAELAKAETEKEEAEMPSEEDKEKAAEEVEPVPEDEDEEREDEDK